MTINGYLVILSVFIDLDCKWKEGTKKENKAGYLRRSAWLGPIFIIEETRKHPWRNVTFSRVAV